MKELKDFKEDIHKCSKCGLCQGECPIYKITGNDCTVSRGQFIMLDGVLKGDLKLTSKINRYLDLCLKCGACSKYCPSGIDVVDIIVSAKAEYFKSHQIEKLKTFILKTFVFGLIPKFLKLFTQKNKSKTFNKKVLYFGGCGSSIKGHNAIVKLMNNINIEVITPDFSCCGIPYFTRGDLKSFNSSIKSFINEIKKYNITEIVTNCASCEKSLKDYTKWADESFSKEDIELLKNVKIKNMYKYLKESDTQLTLKKELEVTYHKPCNINNFEDILYILNNTNNLKYIEMNDFDKCCGLNGISKLKEYKIMKNVFETKHKNIINSSAKIVTTSCLGCEIGLKTFSKGKYKICDLIEILADYL